MVEKYQDEINLSKNKQEDNSFFIRDISKEIYFIKQSESIFRIETVAIFFCFISTIFFFVFAILYNFISLNISVFRIGILGAFIISLILSFIYHYFDKKDIEKNLQKTILSDLKFKIARKKDDEKLLKRMELFCKKEICRFENFILEEYISKLNSKINEIKKISNDFEIVPKKNSDRKDLKGNLGDIKYKLSLEENKYKNLVYKYTLINSFSIIFKETLLNIFIYGLVIGMFCMIYWDFPYLIQDSYTQDSLIILLLPFIIGAIIYFSYFFYKRYIYKKAFDILNNQLEEKIDISKNLSELINEYNNEIEVTKNKIIEYKFQLINLSIQIKEV